MFNILLLARLGPPLVTNWINGLTSLGTKVIALDQQARVVEEERVSHWGIQPGVDVLSNGHVDWTETADQIDRAFGRHPDVIFAWWGSPIVGDLLRAAAHFPHAKTILCVDTLPNASNLLTEMRETIVFRQAVPAIDGFVFYSERMRHSFIQRVPAARRKPAIALIEPWMSQSFAKTQLMMPLERTLARYDEAPHVVFTGRGDQLWTNERRMRKDALGQFLMELTEQGVHVYVEHRAELKGQERLHHYPEFSDLEILEGKFADYISQFDAHLVCYREHNATIRRRVANGLSTRLSFAMTTRSPIAVSESSAFVDEYWSGCPAGFKFSDSRDLVQKLNDANLLAQSRHSLASARDRFSFEAQAPVIRRLLAEVRGG